MEKKNISPEFYDAIRGLSNYAKSLVKNELKNLFNHYGIERLQWSGIDPLEVTQNPPCAPNERIFIDVVAIIDNDIILYDENGDKINFTEYGGAYDTPELYMCLLDDVNYILEKNNELI